jgi:hypothetical protein
MRRGVCEEKKRVWGEKEDKEKKKKQIFVRTSKNIFFFPCGLFL